MIAFRGTYKIDFKNEAYINAIATHNARIQITHMAKNGGNMVSLPLSEQQLGKDLPSIIEVLKRAGEDDITINYRSFASRTLFKVFPKINPSPLAEQLPETEKTQVEKIRNHLMELLRLDELQLSRGRFQHEKAPLFENFFNREAALAFIQDSDSLCFSGALEFPELQTIIFECNDYSYYLTYGDTPRFGCIQGLRLDIDDGFLFSEDDTNGLLMSIVQQLQEYFLNWKKQDYAGSLFPQQISLSHGVQASGSGAPVHSLSHSGIVQLGHFNHKNKERVGTSNSFCVLL